MTPPAVRRKKVLFVCNRCKTSQEVEGFAPVLRWTCRECGHTAVPLSDETGGDPCGE